MSLPLCLTCPPGRCDRMLPRPDGGYTCSHLLSLGIEPSGHSHDPAPELEPDIEPSMPAGRMAVVIALIEQHRCPCRHCNGGLGAHERLTWLRCVECRCAWRIDEIGGRRYACAVREPACERGQEARTAALAARRTA